VPSPFASYTASALRDLALGGSVAGEVHPRPASARRPQGWRQQPSGAVRLIDGLGHRVAPDRAPHAMQINSANHARIQPDHQKKFAHRLSFD